MSRSDAARMFVDLAAQHGGLRSLSGCRVLKQAQINQGKKRLVGGSPPPPAREAKAELLYDGEEVIGVRLLCTCGDTAEIYFEYGEPKELPE